jgi:hypothetical protein
MVSIWEYRWVTLGRRPSDWYWPSTKHALPARVSTKGLSQSSAKDTAGFAARVCAEGKSATSRS